MGKPSKRKIEVKDIEVETDIAFCCVNCNGTHYEKLNDLPSQEYGGIKDGKEFSVIKREVVICSCGQTSILIRYE